MRKYVVFVIAAIMVLSLVACGESDTSQSSSDTNDSAALSNQEEKETADVSEPAPDSEPLQDTWENVLGQSGVVTYEINESTGAVTKATFLLNSGEVWRVVEYSKYEDSGYMMDAQNHLNSLGDAMYYHRINCYRDEDGKITEVPEEITVTDLLKGKNSCGSTYNDAGQSVSSTRKYAVASQSAEERWVCNDYWITKYDDAGLPEMVTIYHEDGVQSGVWLFRWQDGKIAYGKYHPDYEYQGGWSSNDFVAQYDENGILTGFQNCDVAESDDGSFTIIEHSVRESIALTYDDQGNITSRSFTDGSMTKSQQLKYNEEGVLVEGIYTYQGFSTVTATAQLNPDGSLQSVEYTGSGF